MVLISLIDLAIYILFILVYILVFDEEGIFFNIGVFTILLWFKFQKLFQILLDHLYFGLQSFFKI